MTGGSGHARDLVDLLVSFPGWLIEANPLGVYTATRRSADGRHIRCLVAPTVDELHEKLQTAETVEP